MRPLVAAALLLLPLSAGCVELADDPDVQAAADAARDALDEHVPENGHIAGVVRGGDGQAVAGATVAVGDRAATVTDALGAFAALDLAPAIYEVRVDATGHQAWASSYEVRAGEFTRPAIHLTALEPEPEPYFVQHYFDGSAFALLGDTMECSGCSHTFATDGEGLASIVVEVHLQRQGLVVLGWDQRGDLEAWAGDDLVGTWAAMDDEHYEQAITEQGLGSVDHVHLELVPTSWAGEARFHGIVTLFFHAEAPEGYTAFV